MEIESQSVEKSNLISTKEKIKSELDLVNKKLEEFYRNKDDLNKLINNTQNAYDKILDNTKTLFTLLKKDEKALIAKHESSEKIF